jgi:ppGpp synthetase/RelA/SpoT-type nucleotidyltranferase
VPQQPSNAESNRAFDFELHRLDAGHEYRTVQSHYEHFTEIVREILLRALESELLDVHTVDSRAKSVEGFERQVALPSLADPEKARCGKPLDENSDLAAARIVTFFVSNRRRARRRIGSQCEILEQIDHPSSSKESKARGYRSVHYVVKLKPDWLSLPEYSRFEGLKAEIQVRTRPRHAWATLKRISGDDVVIVLSAIGDLLP